MERRKQVVRRSGDVEDAIEDYIERIEREIREREADWSFINSLPIKLKQALVLYIETGDEYKASRLAGLTLDEFNELRIKAHIPKVVVVREEEDREDQVY